MTGLPTSTIDWAEFGAVESFDSYEVDYGSREGGGSFTELLLFHGDKSYRLTVNDLPPELDGPRECPFEIHHPMCLIRGTDVRQLQRTVTYAEARELGLLLDVTFATESVRETRSFGIAGSLETHKSITLPIVGTRVLNPVRRILYIAHRWQAESIDAPAQQPLLHAVQRTVHDEDFVWMDFWSVPADRSDPGKDAAIRSMQAYVFRATALCAVCVSADDYERFTDRTWCQVELFAAMCPVLRSQDSYTGSRSHYDYHNTYKHACDVQVLISDREPAPLDMSVLRNPMRCGITNVDDLELLLPALEYIRDSVRAARPTDGNFLQENEHPDDAMMDLMAQFSGCGNTQPSNEKVSGIDDAVIGTLLRALGNLKIR